MVRFQNLAIQIVGMLLRYGLQMWLYRHLSLTEIGALNLLLVYTTFSTILCGFELHHLVNRPLALGQTTSVFAVRQRLAMAFVLAIFASLTFVVFGYLHEALLLGVVFALVIFLEYLNLEAGRILILRGKVRTNSVLGLLRGISPYLPGVLVFWGHQPDIRSALVAQLICSCFAIVVAIYCLVRQASVWMGEESLKSLAWRKLIPFLKIGLILAALPFMERIIIADLAGKEMLGDYVLAFTFVTVFDTLVQAIVLQPKYSTSLQRFANPSQRSAHIRLLVMQAVMCAVVTMVFVLIFGPMVYGWLGKLIPPMSFIGAVLLLAMSRTMWTVMYLVYYANHQESLYSKYNLLVSLAGLSLLALSLKFQMGMVTALVVCSSAYALGYLISLGRVQQNQF